MPSERVKHDRAVQKLAMEREIERALMKMRSADVTFTVNDLTQTLTVHVGTSSIVFNCTIITKENNNA